MHSMSSEENNKFTDSIKWLFKKLLWLILAAIVIGSLIWAVIAASELETTEVIITCNSVDYEMDGTAQKRPLHYVLNKKLFGDDFTYLYRPKFDHQQWLSGDITELFQQSAVSDTTAKRVRFKTWEKSSYHDFDRNTLQVSFYSKGRYEELRKQVKKGTVHKNTLKHYTEGVLEMSDCKLMSQSELDDYIAKEANKIQEKQKF